MPRPIGPIAGADNLKEADKRSVSCLPAHAAQMDLKGPSGRQTTRSGYQGQYSLDGHD